MKSAKKSLESGLELKGRKLAKNFSADEFACKNCLKEGVYYNKIKIGFVEELQKIRDKLRQPLLVTSGTRCPHHNIKEGGHKNSAHLEGLAVDIFSKKVSITQIYRAAEEINFFTGMGTYPEYKRKVVHLDILQTRFQRWVKRYGKYHYLF